MSYFLTSECVSSGHPDKVADIISDTILDECLRGDVNSKVACETMVTTGLAVVAGEITSESYVDIQKVVRDTINEIGYNKSDYKFDGDSCGIMSAIHEQSKDIAMGVERGDEWEQGAGDQGMMFGYACNETENYMPLPISIARDIINKLKEVRDNGMYVTCDANMDNMKYLRPDAKSQVTVEYDSETNKPIRIHNIVISQQHDDGISNKEMREFILGRSGVIDYISKKYKGIVSFECYELFVNQTGNFVIGGPNGDTGLTGRKIIVDTYGGRCPHGGGAFSGKDPSKVDRSGAYACRHIAKNMVAAGICDEVTVSVSYCIGEKRPTSIHLDMNGTNKTNLTLEELESIVAKVFDMTPYGIITRLDLKQPIYKNTAMYGHFVDGFDYPWERLDYVDILKREVN